VRFRSNNHLKAVSTEGFLVIGGNELKTSEVQLNRLIVCFRDQELLVTKQDNRN
jgi:hypothetical protein